MKTANNLPALTAFTAFNSAIKSLSDGLRINSASERFAVRRKCAFRFRGLDIALRKSQDGEKIS